MSGIYIPNRKLPKCCDKCCFCCREGDVWEYAVWCYLDDDIAITDKHIRHANCPLVAVPDHGRLIDADALAAQGYSLAIMRIDEIDTRKKPFLKRRKRVWRELVPFDYAPTIIPADKEADK